MLLRADVGSDDLQLSHTLALPGDFPLTFAVALSDNQLSQQLGHARLQLWLLLLLGVLLLAPLVLWLGMRPGRDLQQFVSFVASYHDGHFSLPRPPLRWHEQQQLWTLIQRLQQQAEPNVLPLSSRPRTSQPVNGAQSPTPAAAAVADSADTTH